MLKVLFKVAAICCMLFFVVYFLTGGEGLHFPSADDDSSVEAEESGSVQDDEGSQPVPVDIEPAPVETSDAANHLRFKGVPIDGSLRIFVRNMKAKGFSVINAEDGYAVLDGDFAGFKSCEVHVSTLEGHDVVAGITVRFPDRDKWSEIEGDYSALKTLLTDKYGKPASCVEKFANKIIFGKLDDNEKMLKLQLDKCNFETVFKPANGIVILKMNHQSVSHCFISLTYSDRQNSASVRKQAIEDL